MLRKQQEGLPSPRQMKRGMPDASNNVLIASKNKRIKELEETVKRLKGVLECQYARITIKAYDSVKRKSLDYDKKGA